MLKYRFSNSNLLHFNTLFKGRMYVCVNKDSSIAYKETETLEDLKDQKFIMHRITKPIYMDMVERFGHIKILFETNNTETIKKAIAEGIGISCMSEFNLI
ncbi:LysR family transcriptional regulator substrate-binding protein [Niallia sp. Krafla_26]